MYHCLEMSHNLSRTKEVLNPFVSIVSYFDCKVFLIVYKNPLYYRNYVLFVYQPMHILLHFYAGKNLVQNKFGSKIKKSDFRSSQSQFIKSSVEFDHLNTYIKVVRSQNNRMF